MSTAYKFSNPTGIYFISIATVEWVDVFTRKEYVEIVLESLKHDNKDGLYNSPVVFKTGLRMKK